MYTKEINKAINEGKQVNEELLQAAYDYKPSDDVLYSIAECNNQYMNLATMISKLPEEYQEKMLLFLKNKDIIENQLIEHENPFVMEFLHSLGNKTAIDILIENKDKKMTKEDLIATHDLLLSCTSSSDKIGLRKDNKCFVGEIGKNNVPDISFIPLAASKVESTCEGLVDYINSCEVTSDFDSYIYPILHHGLIGAFQLFRDGNTRLGRVVQHAELWNNKNKFNNLDLSSPIVYASNYYNEKRRRYRDFIAEIAVNPDKNYILNEWVYFNNTALSVALTYNLENVDASVRALKKSYFVKK